MVEQHRNAVFMENAFRQIRDLWIIPELKRRQEAGELSQGFELHAAQVLFFPDERKTEVRINNEVQADMEASDPDCGHITVTRLDDVWKLEWDFRYNKALATKHIEMATQFYQLANLARQRGWFRPFVDTLFSAAELAAKARLLSVYPDFRRKASHKGIKIKYNLWGKLQNVPPEHTTTLNRLTTFRTEARYFEGDLSISDDDAQELVDYVADMIEDTQSWLAD